MRILITNDDGIHAPGLKVLETIARTLSDDIWIVAPMEEQSAAGHSLTISRPLRIREHGPKHFSVSGTPTDAVMMAVGHLMKGQRPDLILSGVIAAPISPRMSLIPARSRPPWKARSWACARSRSARSMPRKARAMLSPSPPRRAGASASSGRCWPSPTGARRSSTSISRPSPADQGQGHQGRAPGLPRCRAQPHRLLRRPARLSLFLVRPRS